jgi:hypothetical protein
MASMGKAAEDWQTRIGSAKAGQTIELPAGEFRGGVTLPPGVRLKGAGIGKTIIDATGIQNGFIVEGGTGARISDLTVRDAQGAGVAVSDAQSLTLANVRATGCSNGFLLKNVKQGRIENCISDRNSFGLAISGGADCAVVNCTVVGCSQVGINIAASPNAVIFNNCVVDTAIALNIDEPAGLHVDHNLYFGMFLGQMKDQTAKRILSAWQYLTGLDAHSVQMPVEFKNASGGDFTPVSVLPWALDRATTADWGVLEFAGVKASETDLLGSRRNGRPDVGAIEAVVKAPRAADGSFTVSTDAGTKSAGVFTKDGKLISYLFHNQPLPKGKYSFWLPARNYVGQPISAGDYEVRLAESDFRWKYLNHVADNGGDRSMSHTASFNPAFVAFAPNGLLVMQEGLSEDHTGVRAYDAVTGKLRWYMHGGNDAQGVAIGKNGTIYVLCEHDSAKGESRLTRLDAANGNVIPWPGSNVGHVYPVTAPKVRSMAVLEDRLYAADAAGNRLFIFSTVDGKVAGTLNVPSPRFVTADEKAKLLWIVSGNALLALSPDGTQIAESTAVPDPVAVAARDGQLAVASSKSGKIHFLNASDPKSLKPGREFGQGDGPFGAFAPDRFWFQKGGSWSKPDQLNASVALGPNGQLAVVDYRRTLMFDDAGKNLWYTIGVFGNHSKPSFSTQNRRLWDTQCELSFLLNEKDGTWQPEALWDHSLMTPLALQESACLQLGDFSDGGKTFFVAVSGAFAATAGETLPLLMVARLDGFKSVPVLTVTAEGGKALSRQDTNGDSKITAEDAGQVLADAEGNPLPLTLFHRFNDLLPDGSISVMSTTPMIWKRTGLNAKGVPVYEGKNYVSRFSKEWRQDLSPYDFKPDGVGMMVVAGSLSDGGSVIQAGLRGSGGTGLSNGAGTDLSGYGPDGRRRWVHQLAQHKGIGGMGTVDDITLTAVFYSCETLAMDADGLALGGFCEAPQLHYCGYWIDHPNLRLFKLPDNHLHATIGSNADGRHLWYRLDNQESLKKSRQSFRVSDDRASELAALDWKSTPTTSRPPAPQIRIPRLAQPLTIDGDLEKWRKAGVQPQIVIGPSGAFDGPGDCSAVIRMAYEGQNLYFQILQFDDVPMFYQMVQQDSVEFALNGAFGNGFQFICHKNADGQDIVWRNRFFAANSQRTVDPQHAPRVVRVLNDAKDVSEREALEGLYGVDLSQTKVVLTEFKLPIDKETFSSAENDVFPLGPGKSFWLGFFIDDNDHPYTDVQKLINWPATFGMFSPKEDGALVICK